MSCFERLRDKLESGYTLLDKKVSNVKQYINGLDVIIGTGFVVGGAVYDNMFCIAFGIWYALDAYFDALRYRNPRSIGNNYDK